MVERQLRGRDIADDARARRHGARAARGVRPRADAQARLRGRGSPDRPRPDDLAAVHGRPHRRRRSPYGRGSSCSTSARAPATRRPCSPSSAPTSSRSSGSRSWPRPRARPSPKRATSGSRCVDGDGTLGLPGRAPFDAIAVAAAAPGLPQTLYEQLRPRGRLVVPVGGQRAQRLEVIVRSPEGPAVVHSVPCRFVPLVGGGLRRMKQAHVRVSGRVQGVFFRADARARARVAQALGLGAERAGRERRSRLRGRAERVDSMVAWCRRGPAGRASTTSR